MRARPNLPPVDGIAADLTVTDLDGWVPATALISGDALDDLLATARRRWRAAPHAAAALAWKSYTYWLALPAVLGYAAARRVPLVRPGSVVVHWSAAQPFLRIGLTSVEVAVLPDDPLASASPASRRSARVRVVPDEDALLAMLRSAVVDDHLAPLMARIRAQLHLGQRTLWGSLASGIAHGLSRADEVLPGPAIAIANRLLTSLGLADLVELAPHDGGGFAVRRHTCCLAFTLPEPTICAGCCIQ